MESVGILFPVYGIHPVGGLKVGFEYANRLVQAGCAVHIFYPMNVDTNKVTGLKLLRRVLGYLYFKITRKYKADSWFSLDKRIKQHLVWNLKQNHTKKCCRYIATGIQKLTIHILGHQGFHTIYCIISFSIRIRQSYIIIDSTISTFYTP